MQLKTEVKTDGWIGYENLGQLGCRHKVVLKQGDHTKTDQQLLVIHIVFGNLDAWLLETHHGVSSKHLHGDLNEFSDLIVDPGHLRLLMMY